MNRRTIDLRAAALAALDPFIQICRVMTFRHRGENLSTRLDGQTLAIMCLSTAIGCYRWGILVPDGSMADVVLSYLVATLGFALILPLPIVTISVMACIAADTGAIALTLSGVESDVGPAYWVLVVWMVAATMTTCHHWRAKYQHAAKVK